MRENYRGANFNGNKQGNKVPIFHWIIVLLRKVSFIALECFFYLIGLRAPMETSMGLHKALEHFVFFALKVDIWFYWLWHVSQFEKLYKISFLYHRKKDAEEYYLVSKAVDHIHAVVAGVSQSGKSPSQHIEELYHVTIPNNFCPLLENTDTGTFDFLCQRLPMRHTVSSQAVGDMIYVTLRNNHSKTSARHYSSLLIFVGDYIQWSRTLIGVGITLC